MTPLELWLSDDQLYYDVPRRLATHDGWRLSVHWTQNCFYAVKGEMQLQVPFSMAVCKFSGEVPKSTGRHEKEKQ